MPNREAGSLLTVTTGAPPRHPALAATITGPGRPFGRRDIPIRVQRRTGNVELSARMATTHLTRLQLPPN
eukprot:11825682-Heterocapsa_arctica.AAC.1